MRTISILSAVLMLAMMLAVAGEGACGECLRGCCGANDAVRRLISAIRRLFRRLTDLAEPVARRVVTSYLGFLARTDRLTSLNAEVVPLRI